MSQAHPATFPTNEARVLTDEERAACPAMFSENQRLRLREANRRDAEAWSQVRSRQDWERFRNARLAALRDSLNLPARPAGVPRWEKTGEISGTAHRVEKLVIESRPHLVITANLYLPDPPRRNMPGMLICHSHHNPKTQPELQDMGVNWSRLGCAVMVPDLICHGERRQQPYPGREEYRSRYIVGMQLYLAGESLMGWFVWDLMRCLDVLLARDDVDRRRIVVLGSVAGGGDPAAVLAALDDRVACAVPFNFGGPQPETPVLGEDAESAFNYAGSGSFESTRNLRLSARDGFLPWVIVGAVAPRYLIYAHEFSWDAQRDPVWKRLNAVWAMYDARDRLAAVHGWGRVTIRPPDASHCNNIGPPHRKQIYPLLEKWLGIPAPREEVEERRNPGALACLTDEVRQKYQPRYVHELARELAANRSGAARAALAKMDDQQRRRRLRDDWAALLGDVQPARPPQAELRRTRQADGIVADHVLLRTDDGMIIPTLVLKPAAAKGRRLPVVLALAQQGKAVLLEHRTAEIRMLLDKGAALCLPDVRAAGETDINTGDGGRHRRTVPISATDLMLGQTMLGLRLRDLLNVLTYLRGRDDLDVSRLGVWGDSLAPVNDRPFEDPPQDADNPPKEAEPAGGLLALLLGLFVDDVRAVLVRRCILSWEAVLGAQFCYVPHDVIVPGASTRGELADLAGALAPRPLRIEGPVSGRNMPVGEGEMRWAMEPAIWAYRSAPERLTLNARVTPDGAAVLADALRL